MARKECARMASGDGDVGILVKDQRKTSHLQEKKQEFTNPVINRLEKLITFKN